ncbi:MAG: nucleotidyltransferase domain-containing protein [Pseudomonadota bacterium]
MRTEVDFEITKQDFFKKLCSLPFINAIYLYGSRARGTNSEYSDYDLAIDCPNATTSDWNDIVEFLAEAPFIDKIDSIRYDELEDGLLKEQIDKYKKVLYQSRFKTCNKF